VVPRWPELRRELPVGSKLSSNTEVWNSKSMMGKTGRYIGSKPELAEDGIVKLSFRQNVAAVSPPTTLDHYLGKFHTSNTKLP
jgi:hypothetical protein